MWQQGVENSTQTLFHVRIDLFTYAFEISDNGNIGYSQHLQAILLQKSSSFGVMPFTLLRAVLRTVHFNDQFGFGTIKICNILP